MNTEIIHRPISGDFEEKCFNDTGAVIWVKFKRDDQTEWVGSFGLGDYGIIKVVEEGDHSFIAAQGQGYLINKNTKELIFQEEKYPYIKSVIKTSDPDYIIYSRDRDFKVIRSGKIIKVVEFEWVDGLEFLKQDGNKLIGQIFELSSNEYWNGVTVDLENFEWRIERDIIIDYWGVLKHKAETKKKWWQIF